MRKIDNSSAECEMASADFRNIAPSMVQGFPADNHKGSSVLRLPRKIGGNVLLLHPRGSPFRSPLYGVVVGGIPPPPAPASGRPGTRCAASAYRMN